MNKTAGLVWLRGTIASNMSSFEVKLHNNLCLHVHTVNKSRNLTALSTS